MAAKAELLERESAGPLQWSGQYPSIGAWELGPLFVVVHNGEQWLSRKTLISWRCQRKAPAGVGEHSHVRTRSPQGRGRLSQVLAGHRRGDGNQPGRLAHLIIGCRGAVYGVLCRRRPRPPECWYSLSASQGRATHRKDEGAIAGGTHRCHCHVRRRARNRRRGFRRRASSEVAPSNRRTPRQPPSTLVAVAPRSLLQCLSGSLP